MHNPEPKTPGQLITFEGIDGAGKSTILRQVEQSLTANSIPYLSTREPGGTEVGEAIRQILIDTKIKLQTESELLLFIADRAEHLAQVIKPALKEGRLVLCDRYADSTIAYQGYGYGLDLFKIRSLHESIGLVQPNLTFWLDVNPVVGLERVKRVRKLDSIESAGSQDELLYRRIRSGYQCLAVCNPDRIVRIDANQPINEVTEQVIQQLNRAIECSSNPTPQ